MQEKLNEHTRDEEVIWPVNKIRILMLLNPGVVRRKQRGKTGRRILSNVSLRPTVAHFTA